MMAKYTASFRDPKRPHTLTEWTFEAEGFGDAYVKYLKQVWGGCELLSLMKVPSFEEEPTDRACDHSNLYPGLRRQPCHCGRPGCTKTDTGTSNDICPHWAEDRIKAITQEMLHLFMAQDAHD